MKKYLMALAAGICAGILYSPAAQAQGTLDHMICYRMQDKLLPKATADLLATLQPEFTQKGCLIGKAVQFCVPATKTNVDPPPANPNIVGQPLRDDYICYQVRCPNAVPPPSKLVIDQFGKRQQQRYTPSTVCVPAKKTALTCGFLGTSKMCGGPCPDQSMTCSANAAGNCACTPKDTCDGRPDKAGICGGKCLSDPAHPNRRCLPTSAAANTAPICTCQDPPPPACGIDAATGVCGGTCPNSADKCAMDAAGQCSCQLLPAPCGLDPATRTCGGACASADQHCELDTATNACNCNPPAGCGSDPLTGTCSGVCPIAGDVCVYSTGTNFCKCQPPPCGSDAAGVCGGSCPLPGQQCKSDTTGACNCDPPPCSVGAAGTCGGGCALPGQQCLVDANGVCGCLPPPCGGPVTACGGACPAGQTCGIVTAIPDYCGCQ